MKIISGGQTGVDRAALDIALKYGLLCGGWCPAGRLDERGRIPDRYPVRELPGSDFAGRTRQNVIDSEATVIFYCGVVGGGTADTVKYCAAEARPHVLIDAAITSVDEAARLIAKFVRANQPASLNIAGPRQSEWPEGYDYAVAVLDIWLRLQANRL